MNMDNIFWVEKTKKTVWLRNSNRITLISWYNFKIYIKSVGVNPVLNGDWNDRNKIERIENIMFLGRKNI